MSSKFRTIKPAEDHARAPANLGSLPVNKRRDAPHVARACNSCRVKKSKCDGVKPACSACRRRGFDCQYEPLLDPRQTVRELRLTIESKDARIDELEIELQGLRDQVDCLQQQQRDQCQPTFLSAPSQHLPPVRPPKPVEPSLDPFGFDSLPADRNEQIRLLQSHPLPPPWPRDTPSASSPGNLSSLDMLDPYLDSEATALSTAESSDWPDTYNAMEASAEESRSFSLTAHDQALDRVYIQFRDEARKWLQSDVPLADVLGPDDAVCVDLLYRDRTPADSFQVSSWAAEFNKTLGKQQTWARLATTGFMARLMRWLIYPSIDTYAKMPALIRPTAEQKRVPHRPFFDLLPFPVLRDTVIRKPEVHRLEWLEQVYCLWPGDHDGAVRLDPVSNRQVLTEEFEEFSAEPKNWSVSEEILRVVPELKTMLADEAGDGDVMEIYDVSD